jgi:FkbM family methyltransferase
MALISYAQNYEDVLLNRVFADCPSGFYIDVGAFHPVVHSVTKLFYERGWRGINIEPIPIASEMLASERVRDINLRIGLSNCEGTSTFYECRTSLELSTFSQELAEDLRRGGFETVEHSIPVTTLARVCEQHVGQTVDFLKIDVEGCEREVLEGADWGRYRPRVVLVEATRPATSIPSYEHWEALLLAAEYHFAFFDGLNRYYVRTEDQQLIPLLAVPANFFDDFEVFELSEHRRQVRELRQALEASEESHRNTQAALEATQAALAEEQNALMGMRRAWDDSQIALHEIRARFDSAEAQLAPFLELGPIAVRVARRLRRMSRQSPRLASLAKRVIRSVHPGA